MVYVAKREMFVLIQTIIAGYGCCIRSHDIGSQFGDGVTGWTIWGSNPMRGNRLFSFLCFVDRSSRYIRVMKTNLMHCLSSVYFVSQPLHVSGIFVAHHQEVYCIYVYTTIGTCCAEK